MTLSLIGADLDRALAHVKLAGGAKSRVDALAGVHLSSNGGGTYAEASDLSSTARVYLTDDSIDGLDALVSLADLQKVAKRLGGKTGALALNPTDDGLSVKTEARTVTLPSLRREDYPASPLDSIEDATVVLRADAAELAEAVARVAPHASRDDRRPVLTGIQLRPAENRMAATDSWRLYVGVLPGEGSGEAFTVPAGPLSRAVKGLTEGEVEILRGERHAFIRCGRRVWALYIIDGTYPDYGQLMPERVHVTIKLDREALASAVEDADALRAGNEPVRFTFGEGSIHAELVAPGGMSIEADVPATIEGETGDAPAGYSPRFLGEVLRSLSGDEVSIGYISPMRPLVVSDEAGDTALIMPIRLNV